MAQRPTHISPLSRRSEPAERLTAATAHLVAAEGIAAASARDIAAEAGVSPSAINYNFGGIERLLSSAFARGAGETAAWMAARETEVMALPRNGEGASLALEHVLAEWTGPARPLALLYQEALTTEAADDWIGLWRDFWLRLAKAFGLSEAQGRLLHVFFESEALYHLSRWSPALERAALAEMAGHFAAAWLGASPRPALGLIALAEMSAGARPHGSLTPAALQIAEAAAKVVEVVGLPGLTHRAVAHKAGLTTGAVTHHFRTVDDLVAGAIRGQVQAIGQEADTSLTPVDDIRSVELFLEATRRHAVNEAAANPSRRRRRLFLATVRRPELASAGAVIRFSHGGTMRQVLERVIGEPAEQLTLPAGVLSRLLSALWVATAGDPDPQATRIAIIEHLLSAAPWSRQP